MPNTVTALCAQWRAFEQFSLPVGGTYYFDLSAEKGNVGTVNTALPDTTLHYVPFTYVGTVNAYSLPPKQIVTNVTTTYHSLFVGDYNVGTGPTLGSSISDKLYFGKSYDENYTLRSLSVGSHLVDNNVAPNTNEWDQVLNKSKKDLGDTAGIDNEKGYIKNWASKYSWGQDTYAGGVRFTARRGNSTAAHWDYSSQSVNSTLSGWRPALEVINTDALGEEGLRSVTLNFGAGKLGSNSTIHIICAGDSFKAPSGEGLTRPSGNTGTGFYWSTAADGKGTIYAAGGSVPNTVTTLYAQWEEMEQFNLPVGGTYYFDLTGEAGTMEDGRSDTIGTINTALPDTTLHYVPFTYAGTVNGYNLSSGQVSTDATAMYRSLFVGDYNVSHTKPWNDLNTSGLIFGKSYDENYTLRAMSVGSSLVDDILAPNTNEWDQVVKKSKKDLGEVNGIDNAKGYIKNWNTSYSLGQDTYADNTASRMMRGYLSLAKWNYTDARFAFEIYGWRPVLEVMNADTVASDRLKSVTLDLGGGSLGGRNTINIICAGDSFKAPSGEGLIPPEGKRFDKWQKIGEVDTTYEVGTSITYTSGLGLTALWKGGIAQESTPTATDLIYNLDAVDYDGNAMPVSVTAKEGKNLGTITVKYNGSTTAPTDAGTYAVTVDIDTSANYNAVKGVFLGNYTINKIDYTGTQTVSTSVMWNGEVDATVTLPTLPEGASYDKDNIVPNAGAVEMTNVSISGTILTFTAPPAAVGEIGEMAIPVQGATNYNPYYVVVTVTYTPIATYTITATAGTAGSISPSGSVTVNKGENKSFTIIPDSNYAIADVKIDGVSQGKMASYTFSKVTANHTIEATFSYNGTAGGGATSGGGSSSGDGTNIIITSPPVHKPDTPTAGEIKVNGKVDANGNASVSITDKNINDTYDKALADAKKNGNEQNGITLVLNVNTDNKTVNSLTVNLPKTVQDTLISKNIVKTVVVADNLHIKMSMDLSAVKEINKQAKADVNITAIKVDNSKLTGSAKTAIGNRPAFDLQVNYGSNKQVSSFGEGKVAVEMPYTLPTDENAGNVQAVYVDTNGKVEWLTSSVYDRENKVLHFSTNHFSTYGIGYRETNAAFVDTVNHWAKENIEFVVSRGLFSGTSATTFSPDTAMTRGMFVTVLGRLAGVDVSQYTTSSFEDVAAGAYYLGYVEWGNKKGIVNGIGEGRFAPDQPISREQMAVIMHNYAKVMGLELPKVHTEITFVDNGSISGYAKDAVRAMQMAGIISGKDAGKFAPQDTTTRAEVSTVLKRFVAAS